MVLAWTILRALISPKFTWALALSISVGVAASLAVLTVFTSYLDSTVEMLQRDSDVDAISTAPMTEARVLKVTASIRRLPGVRQVWTELQTELEIQILLVERRVKRCATAKPRGSVDPGLFSRFTYAPIESRELKVHLRGLPSDQAVTTSKLMDSVVGNREIAAIHMVEDQEGHLLPLRLYVEAGVLRKLSPYDHVLLRASDASEFLPGRIWGLIKPHVLQSAPLPTLILTLPHAQRLAGLDGSVNVVSVRLEDPADADQVARHTRQVLGSGFSVKSWSDRSRPTLAFLRIVRIVVTLLFASTVLVAAVGMASTMALEVGNRRRQIALFLSLGVGMRGLWLSVTAFAGFIGAASGALGGSIGAWAGGFLARSLGQGAQMTQSLGLLHAADLHHLLLAAALAGSFSFLAAFIALRRASRTDPIPLLKA